MNSMQNWKKQNINVDDVELIELAKSAIVMLKELEKSENWIKTAESPCEMFTMEIHERVAAKGIDLISESIQNVREFLLDIEVPKKLNPMLLQNKLLHVVQNQFAISYLQFQGIWPVSGRDFVSISRQLHQSSSKIYIASRACSTFLYPLQEDIVRGELFIGGYILEKMSQNSTKITYIADVDLNGSIPNFIKNMLSKNQGEKVSKIGPAMKNTKND